MRRFDGKVAIVTGGARGTGVATARRLDVAAAQAASGTSTWSARY